MNLWKPAAIASTSLLVLLVGYQAAHATSSSVKPAPIENRPNMEAALSKLREAKGFLERAEHNQGGWRAAAIQSTDTAIHETERGIAFP